MLNMANLCLVVGRWTLIRIERDGRQVMSSKISGKKEKKNKRMTFRLKTISVYSTSAPIRQNVLGISTHATDTRKDNTKSSSDTTHLEEVHPPPPCLHCPILSFHKEVQSCQRIEL